MKDLGPVVQPVARFLIGFVLVGGFVASCLLQEVWGLPESAITALGTAAGTVLGFYYGEHLANGKNGNGVRT